jgi:hypothetical protein
MTVRGRSKCGGRPSDAVGRRRQSAGQRPRRLSHRSSELLRSGTPWACAQSGLRTRLAEAGCRISASGGRIGRGSSVPPQLGHSPSANNAAHSRHHVHSKLQMSASALSGARSRPQHSQLGRISSMVAEVRISSRVDADASHASPLATRTWSRSTAAIRSWCDRRNHADMGDCSRLSCVTTPPVERGRWPRPGRSQGRQLPRDSVRQGVLPMLTRSPSRDRADRHDAGGSQRLLSARR